MLDAYEEGSRAPGLPTEQSDRRRRAKQPEHRLESRARVTFASRTATPRPRRARWSAILSSSVGMVSAL